ncbi:hypothetical protein SAMN04515672_1987 [Natronorubrum texcoconense]|uniref:Uncharacterized protein n=1 Tax=Natronorubrum texcoconense TaxID=1095776 RepID=A0A1G8Y1F9_9EURY|nr:hypothetical protein SAMN04515672_1987 [Natronorubrum texcoconense]
MYKSFAPSGWEADPKPPGFALLTVDVRWRALSTEPSVARCEPREHLEN